MPVVNIDTSTRPVLGSIAYTQRKVLSIRTNLRRVESHWPLVSMLHGRVWDKWKIFWPEWAYFISLPFCFFDIELIDSIWEPHFGMSFSQANQWFQLPWIRRDVSFATANFAHFHISRRRRIRADEVPMVMKTYSDHLRTNQKLACCFTQLWTDECSSIGNIISK